MKPLPTLDELQAFREREKIRFKKEDVIKSSHVPAILVPPVPVAAPALTVVALRDSSGKLKGLTLGEKVDLEKASKLIDPNSVFDDFFAPLVPVARTFEIQKAVLDENETLELGFFPLWLR